MTATADTESLTGHYEPAKPGATTPSEARSLYVNGQHVTAEVTGRTVAVFVGTHLLYQGELPAEVTDRGHVNRWVARYALQQADRSNSTDALTAVEYMLVSSKPRPRYEATLFYGEDWAVWDHKADDYVREIASGEPCLFLASNCRLWVGWMNERPEVA